jgi:nitrous-oxide reductase
MKSKIFSFQSLFLFVVLIGAWACKPRGVQQAISSDAASKVYVAPGKHDEFYNIVSGGFSGQMSVYGLPSGRLFRVIPVFSVDPEKGYGYSEETKPYCFIRYGWNP